jgi:hypothetical protein
MEAQVQVGGGVIFRECLISPGAPARLATRAAAGLRGLFRWLMKKPAGLAA